MLALIEESLDAVLIIDDACTIRYANHAMHVLCGYAIGALPGSSVDCVLPEAAAAQRRANDRHRGNGAFGKVGESVLRHQCGEQIPVEMKALDLGMHDGTRYFGAFIEDLRPRRRMEEKHAELMAALERQAMTDPLTEIANRRSFDAEAGQMMALGWRRGADMAVGIADIDHFKKINDDHGHPVGDEVLREIARRMIAAARTTDFVARIGGEEFGLLFPDTSSETAIGVAERIREAIATEPITTAANKKLAVTISIGLATLPPGTALDEALGTADCALYKAKDGGRNRVESL
ncbi:sensor domain-containing diguanylate cyclase [Massilia cavernae]|nr:sensor domain-containing diguanylate cyclase [Massilia cavernae]